MDGKNSESVIDLDALEIEIDKEIDNLFVPAVKAAPKPQQDESPFADSAPEDQGAALDIDALQAEIDREIDRIFIPAAGAKPVEDATEAAASPQVKSEPSLTLQPTLEFPEPVFEPPAPSFSAGPPSAGFKTKYPPRTELPKLVEAFNAAYLSLDWEFSRDNIRRLESALEDLESFAAAVPGGASIFKILKAILSRLSLRPQSASNRVFELVRDSQGLLAHILLMEGPPGAAEKERVNSLISRFRRMRDKALAAKEAKTAESVAPVSFRPTEEPGADPQIEEYEREEGSAGRGTGKMPDRWSLLELKKWMESSRGLLQQSVADADSQLRRIRMVESALGKTSALLVVVRRLADIRAELESCLGALREQDGEWEKRIRWVDTLEKASATYEIMEIGAEPPPRDASAEPVAFPSEEPALLDRTRRENVYVFHYAKRPYGLLASQMVKFKRISNKKARQIISRGHATLADIRPLFRSIRAGVMGELAGTPKKQLEAVTFDLVGPRAFQVSEAPPAPRMAIFVADEGRYGIILADSDSVHLKKDAEITPEACSCHAAIGTTGTEPGLCAEILDVARLFQSEPMGGLEVTS